MIFSILFWLIVFVVCVWAVLTLVSDLAEIFWGDDGGDD